MKPMTLFTEREDLRDEAQSRIEITFRFHFVRGDRTRTRMHPALSKEVSLKSEKACGGSSAAHLFLRKQMRHNGTTWKAKTSYSSPAGSQVRIFL